MTPLRTASRSLTRALVLIAALLVGLAPALPAQAEPSISEIEAEIAKTWEKLEPLVEGYNKVHSELVKLQKKAAGLETKLQPLRMTVEVTRTRVGAIAAEYYKGGRNAEVNALLSSGSPKQFADQLMLLQQIAHGKQEQISATSEAKAKFDGEKAALDKAITDQKAKDTDLAAKKKVIEGEMSRLQKLRTQAYGSGGSGGSLKLGNACPAQMGSGKGQTAASWACKQISKPYVWGAAGPGSFDCSGLTQWAYGKAGISLTHYTKDQWGETTKVSGTPMVGDLVFFYGDLHHVGMYVGTVGGRRVMVHAPHTGDVVRMQYIDVMPVAGYRRP
ncbi:C40 family peptidase [Catellatospora sichuanensis]|uniref:C40 family peptidase n=1 Tax=Catellatospora sichuanensis TaxID=1969805 RepID=UPI0011837CFD|nr:C40 family peptidase [Catellatospora sichuanensis]